MAIDARSEAIRRLEAAIDAREDELIELVAELVRRPSELGDEALAQVYVEHHLADSGLAVTAADLDDDIVELPEAGRSGVPFAGRPNITARRPGAGAGRSLILNGHIDVVSPEPVAAWSHDPWGAEIVGDLMYGRGAYDMKSGVAINLFLARLLHDLEIPLAGDLLVHSVIEEECTGNGALAASLAQRADAAIVTEPMGGGFVHAHLGVLWFRVAITGRAWHAQQARRGVNAIVKAVPVIRALEELDERLNREAHPIWAGTDHPINLNIGVIRGGDWPSTVPGACELHCRLSFYPGQPIRAVRGLIEQAVREAASGDDWLREHPPVVSYDGFQTSGSTVPWDSPLVALLGEHHRRVTHRTMRPLATTAVNDMRYYNFAGVPAGCYGATGGNAHGADEWLDLTSLAPTARVLAGFIVDWCGLSTVRPSQAGQYA